MTRTLKALTPVIMVLLLNACAAKLMPQEIAVQPAVKNEILSVKHKGADVFVLRTLMGDERDRTILISGPFLAQEVGELLTVPAVVNQDFRIIRQESAWLIVRLSCGRVYCEASVQERIKQETGSLNSFRDWWYNTISHPRLLRIDKEKWTNDILASHFGLELD